MGAALNLIVREPGNILNAGNWKCFMHLGAIFTIPSSHPSSCTEYINMGHTEYTHPQKPNQQKWYGHYWIGSCMSIQGTKSVLSELLAFAGTTMIGTANRHCVPEVLQDMTRNSCTYFWWLFVSWMKGVLAMNENNSYDSCVAFWYHTEWFLFWWRGLGELTGTHSDRSAFESYWYR